MRMPATAARLLRSGVGVLAVLASSSAAARRPSVASSGRTIVVSDAAAAGRVAAVFPERVSALVPVVPRRPVVAVTPAIVPTRRSSTSGIAAAVSDITAIPAIGTVCCLRRG